MWKRCPKCGGQHCNYVAWCATCIEQEGIKARKQRVSTSLSKFAKARRGLFNADIELAKYEKEKEKEAMVRYVPTYSGN